MSVRRVVFDTSTLVSAALRPDSIPYKALHQAMRSCDLCASEATLAELKDVLLREKFRRYLPDSARHEFLLTIENHVRLFAVRKEDFIVLNPGCRDPKDNKFLVLAAVSEAKVLVSSDQVLLVLDPWNEVRVMLPGDFLNLVG